MLSIEVFANDMYPIVSGNPGIFVSSILIGNIYSSFSLNALA
jgi:ABC-type microcin C transport system permease subunit YejB